MTRPLPGVALVALLVALMLPAAANAVVLPVDATAVISGTPDLLSLLPTPVGNASASSQAVNRDGTRVAFMSQSDGLVVGDDDAVQNVYVKFVGGAVELVSRADGVNGEPSHGDCDEAAISHDGKQVAFTCAASLDPNDTNGLVDVYVRNLETSRTTLISRTPSGAVGDRESVDPAIAVSGGTTFVAFTSSSTNLLPGQAVDALRERVYRRAIGGGDEMTLVSTNGNFAQPQGDGFHPSISNDGLSVAFDTSQRLDAADTRNGVDVYVRDFGLAQPVSRLVSLPQGLADADAAERPVISGDGKVVAFNLKQGATRNVFRRVLANPALTLVSAANGVTPGNDASFVTGIDDTGDVVGFDSLATNLDGVIASASFNCFVFRNGAVQLVGRAGVAGSVFANGTDSVSVSGDGTKVVMDVNAPGIGDDSDPRFDSVVLRDLDSGGNQTVSRPPGGEPFVNVGGDAFGGSVSGDGRFVAFSSFATGLGVPLGEQAVFMRDVVTGAVTLISREDGANGAPLHGFARVPWISADGRRVAFEHNPDDGRSRQILVRDVPSGRTFLASVADGAGGAPGEASSFAPSISDDGRRVAFSSRATNLVAGDKDDLADVYVRDLDAGRTFLMSRAGDSGEKLAASVSGGAAISGDGRRVAFDSTGSLDPTDSNAAHDVYVHDVDGDAVRRVSIAGTATEGNGDSFDASISRDGNRVSFDSNATNFGAPAGALFVRDVAARTLTVASRADGRDGAVVSNAFVGMLSADGVSFVFTGAAATSIAPGAPGDDDVGRIYERNLVSGETRLISRLSGAGGAPSSGEPFVGGITADGACVTFAARSSLTPSQSSADFNTVFMRAVVANCGRQVPGGGPGPGAEAAVLSGLSLKPARFHVGGRRGGTKVLFRLDKASAVSLRFDRLLAGRKKGKRCSAKVRKGRRCTVVRLAGRVSLAERGLHAGSNTVKFSGRIGKRALKPGRYRLTATPLRGKGRTAGLVVVKAKRTPPKHRGADG